LKHGGGGGGSAMAMGAAMIPTAAAPANRTGVSFSFFEIAFMTFGYPRPTDR
jgi:hypothetical protein